MKKTNNEYEIVISTVEKAFVSASFYWQFLTVLGCIILSFLLYKLTRKFILPRILISLKRNIETSRMVSKYVIPMLFPLFLIIFLSTALTIYSQFFEEVVLIFAILKLSTLFLFLRFLRISSGGTFIASAVGLFLVPALILDAFNLLNPTIAYLDEYALKLGNIRISVYLLIKTFTTLSVVFWFCGLVSNKSKYYIDRSKSIKSSNKTILSKVIDIITYIIIGYAMLKTLGVDMTTFAVIGGAVGVGIGLGLQKIASNFIGGIILLFEKSVEVGDCVELQSGNIFGNIKRFGGRYTLIECPDGREVMVPNEDLITGQVINWTYSNNRARIEIEFGVAYGSDLEKVIEIAMTAAKENPRCLEYPEVDCFILGFKDHDIRARLTFWVSDINEGRFSPKSQVIIALWKGLKENNIEIPFPQRVVTMKN